MGRIGQADHDAVDPGLRRFLLRPWADYLTERLPRDGLPRRGGGRGTDARPLAMS